jgi:endonuclease YncB( thermonuclease family)
VTQPSATPATSGGASSLSLDGIGQPKVGAFTVPQPTSSQPAKAQPATDHVALNLGTGATSKTSTPVAIPDVAWQKPVTAVQSKANTPGERMVVTYVGDGDSVSVKKNDGSSINCRIDSIDAPEVAHPKVGKAGQPYGDQAKKTLQDMILNHEVTVRVSKPATEGKNYGRALCQIEVEGQNIDKKMLKDGMAWLYRRFNSDPELSSLELDAKANRRGLWADPNPVNPENFRRMSQYGR